MSLSIRAQMLESLGQAFFPPLGNAPVRSGEHAEWEFAKAAGSYQGYADALGGLEGKTVLDFGCGWGGESAWLAERAERVVGCDINDQALEHALAFKQAKGIDNLDFVRCGDKTIPLEDQTIDAVFSTNVFEHVMHPAAMLREIHRVLKPGGAFVSSFGPLFYSPLGYHLSWASQVPYAHLLFGLGPVIE
ncbi:MAG: class I SAM-dependent methyltransferase, partial [Planctomycetota bacterium]